MNWAQQELWKNKHNFNLVLKARQLGISTYFCIVALDSVLFQSNFQAGIIAHTLDDATFIFEDKLKYAYDQIRPDVKAMFKKVGDSAKELAFSHSSVIRVGTSLRSATNNFLHISEFGKICAKYPDRAREVVSGAFNTVPVGGYLSIESTAEGKEGRFYEMVHAAREKERKGEPLSSVDFKFHFFPWWREDRYTIGVPIDISNDLAEYFAKLELDKVVKLTNYQKWWYVRKFSEQGFDIYREFPSTPDEAFQASQEGYWYSSQLRDLMNNGHFTNVAYDRALPVHTAWDLGQADACSIWFFQINRSDDINIFDFWQKSDTDLSLICHMLKSKGYNYGTHIWPHDANARDRGGITFTQQGANLGLYGMVLEQHSLMQGINLVKTMLSKCWFDRTKCKEGIALLEGYKKKWNNSLGGWSNVPDHDGPNSHAADAFRYLCVGVQKLAGNNNPTQSLARDYGILRKYWGG